MILIYLSDIESYLITFLYPLILIIRIIEHISFEILEGAHSLIFAEIQTLDLTVEYCLNKIGLTIDFLIELKNY